MQREQLELADLLIDTNNPRIEEIMANQRDAIRSIAADQKEKLAALAADIIEHALNPSDLLLVTPSDIDAEKYVILEGNRRFAAIKALENPELIRGAVPASIVDRFKKLNKEYLQSPVERIPCAVVESRSEASHWIQLRHTGENRGAGIVNWGGAESARFRQRSGKKEPYLQVLDVLEKQGAISKEIRSKVPIASFKRLLGTPYVRTKLGLDMKNGEIGTRYNNDQVLKGLRRVVEDLATGTTKTKNIYSKEDRMRYADNLPLEELPDTSTPDDEFRPLGIFTGMEDQKPSRKTPQPSPAKRKALIKATLRINNTKINSIYYELKRLEVDQFKNAVAVLFRVFMELSLDDYLSKNKIEINRKGKTIDPLWAHLREKLQDVADYMQNKGILTRQELSPVRRAAQKDSFFASSITTFNEYVHNRYFSPSPTDLKSTWDSLESFFLVIWP